MGATGHNGTAKTPKSRTKWLIAGGAAAAALIAVIVIAAVIITPTPTPPPPPPPPPPVDPEALNSLLLTPDEIDAIMGTTNLKPGEIFTAMTTEPPSISDPACVGAQFNAVESVYQGSGYSTVADQPLSGDQPVYTYVNQTAVLFPSAAQAGAFLSTSADAWKRCAGQTLTVTMADGKTYNWTFDDVTKWSAECINARGGADQPFSEGELFTKFQDLTVGVYPAAGGLLRRFVQKASDVPASWGGFLRQLTA